MADLLNGFIINGVNTKEVANAGLYHGGCFLEDVGRLRESEAVLNDDVSLTRSSCRILPDAFQPSAILIADHVMDISGDDIADVVLKQFEAWPTKGRPLVRGGGVKEWVPLSGIVAQGERAS